MSIRVNVYVHEPLAPHGWQPLEMLATPSEAAALMHSWGAKGWQVMAVTPEMDPVAALGFQS